MLEYFNASEIFDRIMVEYSYPECSTAVVTALSLFQRHFPEYRSTDIERAIKRAVNWIISEQRPNGGWYGSWGVCFTYASLFAMQSLELVGQTWQSSDAVRKCCKLLLRTQKDDGGWGEHYTSCELEEYVQHEQSQVVNTAWACLALMHAHFPDKNVIERGLKVRCFSHLSLNAFVLTYRRQFIMSRQQSNGEWLQEDVEGVFNNTW